MAITAFYAQRRKVFRFKRIRSLRDLEYNFANKKVAILGASGFLGKAIALDFQKQGAKLLLFGRNIENLKKNFPQSETHYYEASVDSNLASKLENIDVVINLVGENIAQRWTKEIKEKIRLSRVLSARDLANTIAKMKKKPQVVIQASAVGYYGDRGEEILDENSKAGNNFLAQVAQEWEKAIQPVGDHCHLLILRLGIVLGKNGGLISKVAPLFRIFLGGHLGSGRQYISWIHEKDVREIIKFLITRKESGIFNVTSPQSLPAKEFFREFGKALERPSWLHAPAFVLQALYGEMAREVLLSSQRVLPLALQQRGYSFHFPFLRLAIHNLIQESE